MPKILDFFLLFVLVCGLAILGGLSGLAPNKTLDLAGRQLAKIVWARGADAFPIEPSASADLLRRTKDSM